MTERDLLPRWDGRPGRYEVWFLTMSQGGRGYWIRSTVRAPVAGPPEPRLWFARFDREDPGRIVAVNVEASADADGLRGGLPVRVGDSLLESGRAVGRLSGAGHDVAWDLRFDAGRPAHRLLPAALERSPLATTTPVSPAPDTAFSGTITVDGEEDRLDGVPGHVGHLWGSRHAERWAWAHCAAFEGDGFAFHAVCGQGRRGPVLTPFLTFAGLRVDGEWERLWGISRRRPWGLGTWRISVRGRRSRLEGDVHAPAKLMVRARYLDPDDTPRWCHHTDVASARLVLWRREGGGWRRAAELVSHGTAQAEWAGRTPAADVSVEHAEVP